MPLKNTTHEDLAQIIGFSATIRLSAYYGGKNMTVPKNVSEKHVLAQLIGMSAAKLLSNEYAGERFAVPTLNLAEVELRNARVLEQLRKGESTDKIAAMCGLSIRRVQQLRVQFETLGWLPKILGKNSEEISPENSTENSPENCPEK